MTKLLLKWSYEKASISLLSTSKKKKTIYGRHYNFKEVWIYRKRSITIHDRILSKRKKYTRS